MGGDDDDLDAAEELIDAAPGLLLEQGIAGADVLVDEEDVGRADRRHRKGEARRHAGGINAQGEPEIFAELGELLDVGDIVVEPVLGPALEGGDQPDVLIARRVAVERHVGGEERPHRAAHLSAAARARIDSGEDPKQRGLAGTIVADDGDPLALLERHRQVVERVHPEHAGGTGDIGRADARAAERGQPDETARGPFVDRDLDLDVGEPDVGHLGGPLAADCENLSVTPSPPSPFKGEGEGL